MYGDRLSPEPARHFFDNFLMHGCRNLVLFNFAVISLPMAMVASLTLPGPLHRPIPVRWNWNVFARKMYSAAEFAPVLSKCLTKLCVKELCERRGGEEKEEEKPTGALTSSKGFAVSEN